MNLLLPGIVLVAVDVQEDFFPFQEDYSIIVQLLKLCPTLCDAMDCRMPAFPVHYQLQELAQIHVHQVRDAIQLSHPLSSPSPPAFSLAQHQGLF